MPEPELPATPEPLLPEAGHDHELHEHDEHPHEHGGEGVVATKKSCSGKCADCLACKRRTNAGE